MNPPPQQPEWPLGSRVLRRYASSPGVVSADAVHGLIRRATQLGGRLPLLGYLAQRHPSGERAADALPVVHLSRIDEPVVLPESAPAVSPAVPAPVPLVPAPPAPAAPPVVRRTDAPEQRPPGEAAAPEVPRVTVAPTRAVAEATARATEVPAPPVVAIPPVAAAADAADAVRMSPAAGPVVTAAPAEVVRPSPDVRAEPPPARGRVGRPIELASGESLPLARSSDVGGSPAAELRRGAIIAPVELVERQASADPPAVLVPPVAEVDRPAVVARTVTVGGAEPRPAPVPPSATDPAVVVTVARRTVIQAHPAAGGAAVVVGAPARPEAIPPPTTLAVPTVVAPAVRQVQRVPDAPAAPAGGAPAAEAVATLPTREGGTPTVTVNIPRITDQVYEMIVRRLAGDRQRRGW